MDRQCEESRTVDGVRANCSIAASELDALWMALHCVYIYIYQKDKEDDDWDERRQVHFL